MGTKNQPWGTKPIKDQTQAEFEAHYRENRAREAAEKAEKAEKARRQSAK
jgi:hypothetical protein